MKELVKWIKWGTLIGVIISSMYLLAVEDALFDLHIWIHYILFGLITGVTITTGNNVISRWFPSDSKLFIIVGLLLHFLASVLIFGLVALGYRTFVYSFFPNLQTLVGTSIGVGLSSTAISLFWRYLTEKDERLKLEVQNRNLAVIEERNRIARELHDSVSQNLFGINLNLNTLKYIINSEPEKALGTIDQLQEMVAEIQTEMRLMIYELRPAALNEKGFFEALENLAGLFKVRYNLEINCCFSGNELELDNKRQLTLYRVLQESLNNVARHAIAGKVKIVLEVNNRHAKLKVQDDGKGFQLMELNNDRHLGVRGMRERVDEVGGVFTIESVLNKGTTVEVNV